MSQLSSNAHEGPIVLVDGICHLCQGITKFLIKWDRNGRLRFASLQSDAGQRLLAEGGMPLDSYSSFVLIEDGRYYTRSKAALRLARLLPFPWPLWYGLIVIPPFIRDAVYDIVARNRYRWFGKDDACMIPTKQIRERFLD
ncbi:DCC1-like thiol-disulfide oxidoreductase family protein [Paenibacillus sp. YPG26]|uniref:thiol-disulfide oxidoreductase DCC family protein n=1 Tax=Paenibacillus sp. YPG26 TaxID=2878915 RepID=UPI00203B7526|nr:DCC1-like thiol-disulfide oxidoreductase family protein [Paenibacillus sp. YPG26]USB34104.1 DCC1-like thiol-disulfide oxidoreductase family protein [Paenibacillus sp. YPG26]